MSERPPPQATHGQLLDLVLIGGGHAHVHVLKMLGMPDFRKWRVDHGVHVTLIARDLLTPYSGMLPGFVAGHYTYDEIHLDLVQLCRFSDIRLIHAGAYKITYNETTTGGMVYCDNDESSPIRYDSLSMDVGITPSTAGMTPATLEAIIPVKPIANFCRYYETMKSSLASNYNINTPSHKHVIAVIGGGAGGIELALSMQYSLLSQGLEIQVIVVTRGSVLLEQYGKKVQRIFERILAERKVQVYLEAEVVAVEEEMTDTTTRKRLVLSPATQARYNDHPILVDDVLWCTQASAASWLSEATPFLTTKTGNFIQVSGTFESVSHKGVFACGDCCNMVDNPRPKAGVFAVRAGPPLLENLKNYLSNLPLLKHTPQTDFLSLISTGDKYAVASKGWWLTLEGRYMWNLKDYIDRTWMEKYTVLPDSQDTSPQSK